jgi:hypothetical protein
MGRELLCEEEGVMQVVTGDSRLLVEKDCEKMQIQKIWERIPDLN